MFPLLNMVFRLAYQGPGQFFCCALLFDMCSPAALEKLRNPLQIFFFIWSGNHLLFLVFCFNFSQHHVCALIPQAPYGTVVCFNRCCLWSPRRRAHSSATVTQDNTQLGPTHSCLNPSVHITSSTSNSRLWGLHNCDRAERKFFCCGTKGNCDTLCWFPP